MDGIREEEEQEEEEGNQHNSKLETRSDLVGFVK